MWTLKNSQARIVSVLLNGMELWRLDWAIASTVDQQSCLWKILALLVVSSVFCVETISSPTQDRSLHFHGLGSWCFHFQVMWLFINNPQHCMPNSDNPGPRRTQQHPDDRSVVFINSLNSKEALFKFFSAPSCCLSVHRQTKWWEDIEKNRAIGKREGILRKILCHIICLI